MKIWDDNEVKTLFDTVESIKKNGGSANRAFSVHAKKYNRKPNSVRNYYYKEVDNLLNDNERRTKLKIDLLSHKKSSFVHFERDEEKEIFDAIEKMTKAGMSVRSACFKMCNGDLTKMTRLQNKYQNLKKKREDNVIQFRQKKKGLSDSEINSLFLGLVRLIKKSAYEEILDKEQNRQRETENALNEALTDIGIKEKAICDLREKFDALRRENRELVARLKSAEKQQALKKCLIKNHVLEIEQN